MSDDMKVLICGSLRDAPDWTQTFLENLGSLIVRQSNLQIVTGGLEVTSDGAQTADWSIVQGAQNALRLKGVDPSQRIITMLPQSDSSGRKRFSIGNVVQIQKSNTKSRRYSMVLSCDAVIAVAGAEGTGDVVDLAWAADKPVLPLQATGGAAKDRWQKYGDDVVTRLSASEDERRLLEATEVDPYSIAELCLKIILRSLKPRCFVAMKMSNHPLSGAYEAIKEAVEDRGYAAVRLDQDDFSGNIVEAIRQEIRGASAFLADLTGYNPNVFYELGIAHGLDKKVMLTVFDERAQVPLDLPFDVRVQRVFSYGTSETLRSVIRNNLPAINPQYS